MPKTRLNRLKAVPGDILDILNTGKIAYPTTGTICATLTKKGHKIGWHTTLSYLAELAREGKITSIELGVERKIKVWVPVRT